MKHIVSLLPYQMRFMRSPSKFLWLCAGIGTGKTFTLAEWLIFRMLTNPETIGLAAAATYSQLRDTTLAEITNALDRMGLTYSYSTLTNFLTLDCNGARLKTFSLENYEMLRGIEVGYFGVDEACLIRVEAYNVLIGRLRCKHSHNLQGRFVSSPRGFDFMYDRFAGDLKTKDHEFIRATSYDNPHLPAGYIESLTAAYDKRRFDQEVMAKFVSLTEGSVYHAFDRSEHLRPTQAHPGLPIYVGMDFNVNPMTATLANAMGGGLRVFDEIYLSNSNTFAMAAEIRSRYPHDRIIVVPDASGSARKTSSSQSDHEILRSFGFELQSSKRNPAIEDRFNTVNHLLMQARLVIDPSCIKLARDLERVTHEKNPEYLTHISDALGYLAWRLFPVKRGRKPATNISL